MAEIDRTAIAALAARLAEVEGYFHLDELRARIAELEEAGIVGGCCGTGPEYIVALRDAVR